VRGGFLGIKLLGQGKLTQRLLVAFVQEIGQSQVIVRILLGGIEL
jgi:hypothetical protein